MKYLFLKQTSLGRPIPRPRPVARASVHWPGLCQLDPRALALLRGRGGARLWLPTRGAASPAHLRPRPGQPDDLPRGRRQRQQQRRRGKQLWRRWRRWRCWRCWRRGSRSGVHSSADLPVCGAGLPSLEPCRTRLLGPRSSKSPYPPRARFWGTPSRLSSGARSHSSSRTSTPRSVLRLWGFGVLGF